jgi:ferredoxin
MTARISVDRGACQKHGQCVAQAPGIFSFDDEEELRYRGEVDDEGAAAAEDAVFLCPTQAITIEPLA